MTRKRASFGVRVAAWAVLIASIIYLFGVVAYFALLWWLDQAGVDPPACRLLRAIARGHHAEAMMYIDAGHGLESCWGEFPIHIAAGSGRVVILKELLQRGADPSAENNAGMTPLMCARSWTADLGGVLDTLIGAGADINARSSVGGWTALHFAASQHEIETVVQLIARGADVNATDDVGRSPLQYAIEIDNQGGSHRERVVSVAKELIKAGADPTAANIMKTSHWILNAIPELRGSSPD